jgi:hypothetical protein
MPTAKRNKRFGPAQTAHRFAVDMVQSRRLIRRAAISAQRSNRKIAT